MPLFIRPTWPDRNRDTDFEMIYREDFANPRTLSVGRIHWCYAGVPKTTPWSWHVEFHQTFGRVEPHDGLAADFESAKAAWKRCWDSACPPINWPPALRRDSDPPPAKYVYRAKIPR